MIPLVLLAAAIAGWCALASAVRRSHRVEDPEPWREEPCDGGCGRLVHPARAHTHHHEPGCGTGGHHFERCPCDFYLCPECCPCDVLGLLRRAS